MTYFKVSPGKVPGCPGSTGAGVVRKGGLVVPFPDRYSRPGFRAGTFKCFLVDQSIGILLRSPYSLPTTFIHQQMPDPGKASDSEQSLLALAQSPSHVLKQDIDLRRLQPIGFLKAAEDLPFPLGQPWEMNCGPIVGTTDHLAHGMVGDEKMGAATRVKD